MADTALQPTTDMETIVSLCKRRGFIFQSSEIYGGLGGAWDYGPLGVEMKNNVKLKHQKEGRYVGTGQVMMAGKWDVTVMVKRAGKEIGSKKFPVTAQ